MQKIIFIVAISVSTLCNIYSQKVDALEKISHSELETYIGSKEIKNSVDLKNYQTSRGEWLSIGDTLIIGKPSNANNLQASQYTTSKINNHSYIFLGTAGSAMLLGYVMNGNETMVNDKVYITEITMARASKKNPFETYITFEKVGGGRFMGKKIGRAAIEQALETGEIINPSAPMSRKEAISKLKESKELLELEMMTEDEYERIKEDLTPIIKGQ